MFDPRLNDNPGSVCLPVSLFERVCLSLRLNVRLLMFTCKTHYHGFPQFKRKALVMSLYTCLFI